MHAFVYFRIRHCVGDPVGFVLTQPVVRVPRVGIPDFIVVADSKVNVVVEKYVVLIRFGILLVLGVNPQNTRQSRVLDFNCFELLGRKLCLIWVFSLRVMIIDDEECQGCNGSYGSTNNQSSLSFFVVVSLVFLFLWIRRLKNYLIWINKWCLILS